MSFAIFHYTLFMLLASILASATCFSDYLVSHKRLTLFACVAFLAYFFDIAWVFQDDFLAGGEADSAWYLYVTSWATLVTGCVFLTAFWLLICEYLGEKNKALKFAPAVIFVLVGTATLMMLPQSEASSRFLFYLPRELYLFWMLIFVGFRYLTMHDVSDKTRLKRHVGLYVALWVLGIMILLEDAVVFLQTTPAWFGPRIHSPERNFSENMLMMVCAFLACRDAIRSLSMRFDRPPKNGNGRREEHIDENLLLYGKRHQLSERECEVLRYILLGSDNQNIASSMQLALSTVKVHVHNILQKTGKANRQELMQDFWKMG